MALASMTKTPLTKHANIFFDCLKSNFFLHPPCTPLISPKGKTYVPHPLPPFNPSFPKEKKLTPWVHVSSFHWLSKFYIPPFVFYHSLFRLMARVKNMGVY
jgi:hypothetical protein